MNEIAVLSDDIHVITAEINAYQRVAGEAIFEIGRRIEKVRREKLAETRGGWTAWLREIEMSTSQADRFIKVFREYDGGKLPHVGNIGFRALYEIATMPEEARTETHTVPTTGETKTVDEMTVRELREVKAELKRKDALLAEKERSEAILTRQNERLTDELSSVSKSKETVVEKVVTIDNTDHKAIQRLKQYEERFGALENYSDRVRATNVSDATTAIVSFNMAVRDFIKRHAFLIKYNDTIQYVDQVTQREYNEAVQALKEISVDFSKVTGIGDFVDVGYTEVQQ